jgi:Concanavalin A-like lectin/glucanases superfamily
VADPWELILHHSYTGTPGVVFDDSPGRDSHGVLVNLTPADFLTDGQSPGSGAVSFLHPRSRIRVEVGKSWNPLGGVRGEVVCLLEIAKSTDVIVDGGSFWFAVRNGALRAWFNAQPHQYQVDSRVNGFDPSFTVPVGQWMTLGFLYDGASKAELSFNGTTVARLQQPLWPVNPSNRVFIGDIALPLSLISTNMAGQIDDVKIWRINPHRADDEFTGRPVDEGVKECWAQWTQALRDVLSRHLDCAIHLRDMIRRAIDSLIRDGLNHGVQTDERWHKAADSYRDHWSHGDLADIVPVLVDLVTWLRLAGLDPRHNPDVVALLDDACLKTILEEAPPPNCDPQFTNMLRDLASALE